MRRARAVPCVILASLLAIAVPVAVDATPQTAPAGGSAARTQTASDTQTAKETRDQLMAILRRYPPALGRLIRQEGSLLSNEAFLAPYPQLTAFLAQHPEVKHDPSYYFADVEMPSYYYNGYQTASTRMWGEALAAVGVFVVVLTILGAIAWLVRTLIDYRRWHRLSRVQTEVHTKLLDRLTSNAELLAYIQSPAGNRFLQSAPIALDPGGRPYGAPFGRILLSVQAGVVLAMAGVGFYHVSGQVNEDAAQPFYALGVFGIALGVGFIVAAAAAYVLSKRMGLFDAPNQVHPVERRELIS